VLVHPASVMNASMVNVYCCWVFPILLRLFNIETIITTACYLYSVEVGSDYSVKIVPDMTYNVFGRTLNLAQSINLIRKA